MITKKWILNQDDATHWILYETDQEMKIETPKVVTQNILYSNEIYKTFFQPLS